MAGQCALSSPVRVGCLAHRREIVEWHKLYGARCQSPILVVRTCSDPVITLSRAILTGRIPAPSSAGATSAVRSTRRAAKLPNGSWWTGYVAVLTQTPSTCTNIGLFTLNALLGTPDAPPATLVVSGPNFGRNTGTAFSVSSGTLGAALAGSLGGVHGVAISYGHFATNPPTLEPRDNVPKLSKEECTEVTALACKYCVSILQQLWDGWANDAQVQVYSINVPLCETLKVPKVCWTRIWHSQHVQQYPLPSEGREDAARLLPLGVPIHAVQQEANASYLDFRPNLARSMRPVGDEPLEEGTDAWAICHGYIGISRLVACFEQVRSDDVAPPTCSL